MHEFNIIEKYFKWENPPTDVVTPVGDDATVLDIPTGKQLVTSIDTLISGVHFPKSTAAFAIGHKALAVNLSDLAAMGAEAKWFTLALTLPEIDEIWLKEFSFGLRSLADKHNCYLVGGDTTRGPLSISIQVMGLVEEGKALLRSGAKVGDKIYVTGSLGDAAVGLNNIQGKLELEPDDSEYCQQRLNLPTPRLKESRLINQWATSCIDVSDGLLQDLSHILEASKVGASIDLFEVPLSPALKKLKDKKSIDFALNGGDDYELLFTIPFDNEEQFLSISHFETSCVGFINESCGKIVDENGQEIQSVGYNHFS